MERNKKVSEVNVDGCIWEKDNRTNYHFIGQSKWKIECNENFEVFGIVLSFFIWLGPNTFKNLIHSDLIFYNIYGGFGGLHSKYKFSWM